MNNIDLCTSSKDAAINVLSYVIIYCYKCSLLIRNNNVKKKLTGVLWHILKQGHGIYKHW